MDKKQLKGIVFFDLDGTLLNNDSKIDSNVKKSIDQLVKNSILPVISTGRSPQEIETIIHSSGIKTVITLNGSLIKNNQVIVYQKNIPENLKSSLMNFINSRKEAVSMFNNDYKYRNSFLTNEIILSHKEIDEPLPEENSTFYIKNNVNMFVIYTSSDGDEYKNKFSELSFYKTGTYSLDCIVKTESKKEGIKHLISSLNLHDIPTYAFGDGPNDIEMLKYVDHPVVMKNASPNIYKFGEFITDSNIDDGITKGLQHFNLI